MVRIKPYNMTGSPFGEQWINSVVTNSLLKQKEYVNIDLSTTTWASILFVELVVNFSTQAVQDHKP